MKHVAHFVVVVVMATLNINIVLKRWKMTTVAITQLTG
jgi:hypothetical protein